MTESVWRQTRLTLEPALRCLRADTADNFLTVVTSLTLAILIFQGYSHSYFAVPFQLLAIAFLVLPTLQRSGFYWFVIACFSASAVWLQWWSADNHKYLLFYWTLVLFLAFDHEDDSARSELIRQGARYLLFFTMAVAVIQKTISPDYLNGDFFTTTLLTDSRFTAFTALFSGMSIEALQANLGIYRQATDANSVGLITFPNLVIGDGVRRLALAVTWLNYLDQLCVALLLLFPLSLRGELLKHLLLMLFIVLVYAVAPVIGFGWLITVWGYCLVPDELAKLRLGYVALFLLVSLYEVHWIGLLV